MRKSLPFLFAALAVVAAYAVDTRTWQQSEMADFTKGDLTHLSIRSDGRITLAPMVKELFDSSTAYLWALARDSKGTLYTAGGEPGGSTAKLFVIDSNGKPRKFAELDGLEVHALAIDQRDRLYAATAPDGKVYRVSSDGKSEVFYDPHAKYIWALAFNRAGDLYVATGDEGEIHRVAANGKGSVFFRTEEAHARSLTFDADDNLIVGTEPGGLILRITPAGQGFVIYQAAKREITAVAVAPEGSIYAAAVGNKEAGLPTVASKPIPTTPTPAPAPAGTGLVITTGAPRASNLLPTLPVTGPAIAGGSEIYRIAPDGSPHKVWSQPQEIVYAITLDRQGRPIVGTGNKGSIYRLDSDLLYTQVLSLPPTQVTAFCPGPDGMFYAITGNIGKVYQIGPGSQKEGALESDVFDGGAFTYWGRLSYRGEINGGTIGFQTRSGNLNRPQKNWSPWATVNLNAGNRVTSPSARFVQYKLSLMAAPDGSSPEVTSVEIAYLAKNIAPVVEDIETTPPNYKFPAPSTSASAPSTTLTLPPMTARKSSSSGALPLSDLGASPALTLAKGHIGARWRATDENGDSLIFRIEIRGVQETQWKLLRDKVREKYFSWDSTSFADGEYVVRVTASDLPSNPPDQALSAELESDPFLIDNTPPEIIGLTATPVGNKIELHWKAKDALNVVDKAEYSVNGGEWTLVDPATKLSDSTELEYRLVIDRPAGGEVTIAVRVTDDYDNESVAKAVVK